MNKPLSNTMNYNETIFIKVPQITIFFWIVKILTTGMGEVFSDFLFKTITHQIIAVVLGLIGLSVALKVQLSMQRYVAWIYWLTVIMVSIFGTMFSDIFHVVIDPSSLTKFRKLSIKYANLLDLLINKTVHTIFPI
jgi:uncharacterized membrane-anchored protein